HAMIRRLVLLSGLLAISNGIFAGNTCNSTRTGNWSDPGTWNDCAGGIPGPADQAIIQSGHVLTYDLNTPGDTVSRISILPAATLKFAPGDHRLQVNDPGVFAIWNQGTISLSNGAVFAFRSDSGFPGITLGNDSELNSDGVSLGPLRSVNTFSVNSNSSQCAGSEMWNVGISIPAGFLLPGDLVQFASGGAQGRMFEVVATQSKTIKLCPALPDGSSLGPRLTPHATTLAQYQPGAVPAQAPAAGDSFWAWHPWKIVKAGSYAWLLTE